MKKNGINFGVLVFVCQLFIIGTFFIPIWFLKITNDFYHFLQNHRGIKNPDSYILYSYVILYIIFFVILFFYKKIDKDIRFSVFAFIHFFLLSVILFSIFAPNDGQSIFLIHVYCLVSAILSLPLYLLWGNVSDYHLQEKK